MRPDHSSSSLLIYIYVYIVVLSGHSGVTNQVQLQQSSRCCVTYSGMTATLSEVVAVLHKMAPLSLAESWDNVGLLMEPDCSVQRSPVRRVFLTNDLTEDVLAEAETVNADLIVSYHPPVFVPFKRITSDAWKVGAQA